jgi:hypothetical protein
MVDHGSYEKGFIWADGHTEYKDLYTVVTEVVAGFTHLYVYGVSKVTFLSTFSRRTIHNLENVDFPTLDSFNYKHWCTLPCYKFPKFDCATKTAHTLYDWCTICRQILCLKPNWWNIAILPPSLQHYKMDVYICLSCHSAMATSRKRSSAHSDARATRKNRMEELESTNFFTYWPNSPAFDQWRALPRRLFFINVYRTKYVSVGFYPSRDYLPQVEFRVVRRGGVPKTLILSDEQVDAMEEALPMLRDDMCSGGTSVGGRRCESCAFGLDLTRSRRTARL